MSENFSFTINEGHVRQVQAPEQAEGYTAIHASQVSRPRVETQYLEGRQAGPAEGAMITFTLGVFAIAGVFMNRNSGKRQVRS